MKLVSYSPERKDEWNSFVASAKNGLFMFNRDYMDYHSDRFTDHSLLLYDDAGRLLALFPANLQDGVLYSHQGLTFGGFITASSMRASVMLQAFEQLKTRLRETGICKLIYKVIPYIYHRQPAQEDIYALFRNQASCYRVDISATVKIADRIPFSELRKRGLKKAHKAGVTIQQSYDLGSYVELVSTTLRDKYGARPVHSAAELELLSGRFPDHLKLYTAQIGDALVAGVFVFEYENLAHAQYIAASDEGLACGALDALFSELIVNVYCQKDHFDFGISTEGEGQFLNEGLISQKEGFGARAVCHEFFELRSD